MKLQVRNRCPESTSYRAARVKSLFNAESGAEFNLDADLPIEGLDDWRIGVIVGPSGSGKTSLGRMVLGEGALYEPEGWAPDAPIIDSIAPGDEPGTFDAVTGALASVGLGSVPAWLRPYGALSNGEKFRADMARIICEAPERVVLDEFTSVVDRQIAKIGALAFSKAWRRTGGQAVLLSCHYDILDWVQPDWVYDTGRGEFTGRWLQPRPRFDLRIWETDWRYWPMFEPHHYLKLPRMIGAKCYVGTVNDEPVCHIGVGSMNKGKHVEARACRLVVMPEWQGAGVGMRFLNAVCEIQRTAADGARLEGRRVTSIFHTSHPGLCAALRRDPKWRQLSARLHGQNKARSRASLHKTMKERVGSGSGYGGHFRAVQGFRYYGPPAAEQAAKAS